MKKKKILGIVLIIAAAVIGIVYLYQTFGKKTEPVTNANKTPETVSYSAVTKETDTTQTPVPTIKVTPDADNNENRKNLDYNINPDMLGFMRVSEQEVKEQLKIYANSCGYGTAEKIQDMDEMIVNYEEKTITIPCYFSIEGKISKFDMIYQWEKKKYRFVLW